MKGLQVYTHITAQLYTLNVFAVCQSYLKEGRKEIKRERREGRRRELVEIFQLWYYLQ